MFMDRFEFLNSMLETVFLQKEDDLCAQKIFRILVEFSKNPFVSEDVNTNLYGVLVLLNRFGNLKPEDQITILNLLKKDLDTDF